MPTNTYTPLATITLTGTASSVTFSSIPATYRDLVLVVEHKVSGGGETDVQFNADTGNNYSTVTMRAGASASTFSATFTSNGIKPQNSVGGSTTVGDFFRLEIMDYSATDKHKTSLLKSGNGSTSFVQNHAVRWLNTAAITSVKCTASGTTYAVGSTFSLYGVIS
jgi:hypothetical protein